MLSTLRVTPCVVNSAVAGASSAARLVTAATSASRSTLCRRAPLVASRRIVANTTVSATATTAITATPTTASSIAEGKHSPSSQSASSLGGQRRAFSTSRVNAATNWQNMAPRATAVYPSGGGANVDIYNYPPRGRNTGINICPQGTAMVIERFGKFLRVVDPGLFFAIPVVDQIKYVHDIREMAIRVEPQEAISKDNVTVRLGGTCYLKVFDAKTASYGATKPLYALVQHSQSALRAAVGTMDLDDLFHARDKLNTTVRSAIADASAKWGVEVMRFEILEILPDDRIRQAMDLQAVAERERREEILRAEAAKRAMELRSEGKRTAESNESEGLKIRMINEGEGEKSRIIMAAQAEASAIRARAEAQAGAITEIAQALTQPAGDKALAFQLSKEYFAAFSSIAGSSNTLIIPQNVADMPSMIATGTAIIEQVRKSTNLAAGAITSGDSSTPALPPSAGGAAAASKQSEGMTAELNQWKRDTTAHPAPASHLNTTRMTGSNGPHKAN